MILLFVVSAGLLKPPDPGLARDAQSSFQRAQQTLESLTGKPFRRSVPLQSQTREEFQDYLRKQLRASFSEEELSAFTRIYEIMGLLPDDYDLNTNLMELYRSQAGAYYDPSTGSIQTLSEELTENQKYFIYLHELVHAHQDQYFDLAESRKKRVTQSFDSITAYNFVIEGHANLVSMAAQLGVSQLSDDYFSSRKHLGVFRMLTRFTSIDSAQMDMLEQLADSSQLTRNLRAMKNTPGILIKQMLDPYFWGQYYWYEKAAGSSWDQTLTWLEDPPTETRKIIYRTYDEPTNEDASDLGSEPRSEYSDSMGVYFLLRWFEQLDTRPSWGSSLLEDRLSLVSAPEDDYVSWALDFSSEKPAAAFMDSVRDQNADVSGSSVESTFTRDHGSVYATIRQSGSTVVLYLEDDPEREPYEELRQSSTTGDSP